ncbi:ATP-binding protein [Paractinoplanes atraurantiacus]|uniref:Regulatory protein, luxR family n=1 Tax=Paractinoplanes atraurantiacus TaxID=1036182 RepID=A0A285J3G2_9ACTN|nr:LuxR family transcriptional regulator [Actinoplanes atraurantiacus]SNY53661.1 regulatory protein, luxR family [Actinoplanes atraurantiacus]
MILPQQSGALVGRAIESEKLGTLLEGVHDRGTAVLIEGTPGIGKTSLLQDLSARALVSGFRELAARGVQGVGATGFGGLHQVLHPVLDRVAALPESQRAALLVAFGEQEGPAPDRLLISLAVQSLLEEAAAAGPLLITVDDLHWLDRSSADVIAFVARRLAAAPVLLVATTRTDAAYPDRGGAFPEVIRLSTLAPEDASALLDRVAPELGARPRRKLLAAASGNPLALRELAAATAGGSLDDSDRLPMTERLEQAFMAEVNQLPVAGRSVLLLAAAGEDLAAGEFEAALGAAGLSPADLEPVERSGLLRMDGGRAVFSHPLVSSAVYGGASLTDRAGVHTALASVAHDPGRAALHRAAAAFGFDEDVAADLEAAANQARRHGAHPEAMIAFRRAAALSPAVANRVRRLAAATESARAGGLSAEAADLVREALPLAQDPTDIRVLARAEWLLSVTGSLAGPSVLDLVALAARLGRAEGARPADQIEILLWAASNSRTFQEPEEVRRVVRAALEEIPPGDRDELHQVGMALIAPGGGATFRDLSALAPRILAIDPVIMNFLAFAAEGEQDLATAVECWTIAADHHHAAGRLGDEATAICGRSSPRIVAGDLIGGLADGEQALRLSADFDLGITGAMAAADVALGSARIGDLARARSAIEQLGEFPGAEVPRIQAVTAWAEGLIALDEGRYADALTALEGTSVNEPIELWAAADSVEAAVRAGRTEAAQRRLAMLATAAAGLPGATSLQHARARAQALLAVDGQARELFEAAVEHGLRAGSAFDLGRTRLLFGEWLRRARHVAEAREQLTAAVELLREAGAESWAARAGNELALAGSGVAGQRARQDPTGLLTTREAQVAGLAARGLTNNEIAGQLHLSPRTVADHLQKIFGKLGISQRSQLAVLWAAGR